MRTSYKNAPTFKFAPDPAVADPAVDLVVGPVADRGGVDGLVAERAAEAVAVVPAGRSHHLLRLEHLSVAPNRILLFKLVGHARSESILDILYSAGLESGPQFATIFRQVRATTRTKLTKPGTLF